MSEGERVLITGASRGIGLALAERFLAGGWRVFAACRAPERAAELAALAERAGGALSVHPLEVTRADQREALREAVGSKLDVLMNNAGTWGQLPSEFGDTGREAWLQGFDTNVIAAMQMMETFAGALAASGRGRILNVTSRMGSIADNDSGGCYAYRAAKAALNAVTRSAALDLRPRGIAVACVHPGWVRTQMGGASAPLAPAESAAGLVALAGALTVDGAGRFYNHDGGELPW